MKPALRSTEEAPVAHSGPKNARSGSWLSLQKQTLAEAERVFRQPPEQRNQLAKDRALMRSATEDALNSAGAAPT